jgi:hypothetical protein
VATVHENRFKRVTKYHVTKFLLRSFLCWLT